MNKSDAVTAATCCWSDRDLYFYQGRQENNAKVIVYYSKGHVVVMYHKILSQSLRLFVSSRRFIDQKGHLPWQQHKFQSPPTYRHHQVSLRYSVMK